MSFGKGASMFKLFKRSGVDEFEEVVPRIITLSCSKCGKAFSHAVLACSDTPDTTTIKDIRWQDNSFGLWLFCSKECAEEFMSREEIK